jgi:hypothetical protein
VAALVLHPVAATVAVEVTVAVAAAVDVVRLPSEGGEGIEGAIVGFAKEGRRHADRGIAARGKLCFSASSRRRNAAAPLSSKALDARLVLESGR